MPGGIGIPGGGIGIPGIMCGMPGRGGGMPGGGIGMPCIGGGMPGGIGRMPGGAPDGGTGPRGGGPDGGTGTRACCTGFATGAGTADWKLAQYSMKFMMCFRPEWCCLRPGTDECVRLMSQYSQ